MLGFVIMIGVHFSVILRSPRIPLENNKKTFLKESNLLKVFSLINVFPRGNIF